MLNTIKRCVYMGLLGWGDHKEEMLYVCRWHGQNCRQKIYTLCVREYWTHSTSTQSTNTKTVEAPIWCSYSHCTFSSISYSPGVLKPLSIRIRLLSSDAMNRRATIWGSESHKHIERTSRWLVLGAFVNCINTFKQYNRPFCAVSTKITQQNFRIGELRVCKIVERRASQQKKKK